MGMYDDIFVKDQLPLSQEMIDFGVGNKNTYFQSKDLECAMAVYKIENGELFIEKFAKTEWIEGDKKSKSLIERIGYFKREEPYFEKVPHHGDVGFYDFYDVKKGEKTYEVWVEFNARFGDPETQPIVMRMKGDIVPILEACIHGNLSQCRIEWDNRPSVCVVMASGGYPGNYDKGKVIHGLEEVARMKDVFVFHAATSSEGGRMMTNGGRVLGVTGLGEGIPEAIKTTFQAVKKITWEGVHYRTDIGKKALQRASGNH